MQQFIVDLEKISLAVVTFLFVQKVCRLRKKHNGKKALINSLFNDIRQIAVMKENCQKIALAKYLADANFGYCKFFPEPKVALGKDPLFFDVLFAQISS